MGLTDVSRKPRKEQPHGSLFLVIQGKYAYLFQYITFIDSLNFRIEIILIMIVHDLKWQEK